MSFLIDLKLRSERPSFWTLLIRFLCDQVFPHPSLLGREEEFPTLVQDDLIDDISFARKPQPDHPLKRENSCSHECAKRRKPVGQSKSPCHLKQRMDSLWLSWRESPKTENSFRNESKKCWEG